MNEKSKKETHLPANEAAPETETAEKNDASSPIKRDQFVMGLVCFCLLLAFASGLGFRFVFVPVIMVTTVFSFTLALAGAGVLFHFFESSANYNKDRFKLGGAIAGFAFLYWAISGTTYDLAVKEAPFSRVNSIEAQKALQQLAVNLVKIESYEIEPLKDISSRTIQESVAKLELYSIGQYSVHPEDLPTQVLPLIDNVEKSYLAVQYLIPEKFWNQYWSENFFQKNIAAAKRPGVKVERIFIVRDSWDENLMEKARAIVRRHVENGVPVRVIHFEQYSKEQNETDLEDFVIFDEKFTGHVGYGPNGDISSIIFSASRAMVNKRLDQFKRLEFNSIEGEKWLAAET